MRVRRVRVRPPEVVFLKGIFEASEGLGAIFAEKGGELFVASPIDRTAELDELLADLASELGASIDSDADPLDQGAPSGAGEAAMPRST
jgi:hypothetical protein